MTLFSPNLRVNEMKVMQAGAIAFHEKFHSGLNIIRGQNSSGKSTIMDFLFYGLGGDLLDTQWREAAANCDSVMLEVTLNGNVLTLWRDVEAVSQRPMKLFYGGIDEASQTADLGWETYSFRRSNKESFSQVLFRFLNLPQVEYGESNARLTVNQILRLLYADQMSPMDKIFRPQRGDLAITRQAVGDMLCGAYSDEYYMALIRRKEATEEFRIVSSQVSSLMRTHGKSETPLTEDWLDAEQSRLERRLDEINTEIDEVESKVFDSEFTDHLTLDSQNLARERVVELQQRLSTQEAELMKERLADADVTEYLSSLDRKLKELHQAHVVVEEVGGLTFSFCPACFAPVGDVVVDGACSLCKSAHDPEESKKRVLKLMNEYARQRERAIGIQKERSERIIQLNSRIEELRDLWEQASAHYRIISGSPTSELRARLSELHREYGYARREMEDLARLRSLVSELVELTKVKEELQREIDLLDAVIDSGKRNQQERLRRARTQIEAIALDFLKRDLARQSTFEQAEYIKFEFDGDRLSVNDETFFSASSMVYLRNSFFASFLFAAANDPDFLHPRFLMMDTIEDKGMEPERSKNFQLLLREKSSEARSEHQIIIATSMIAEELDTEEFTVGERYTHDRRTLSVSA